MTRGEFTEKVRVSVPLISAVVLFATVVAGAASVAWGASQLKSALDGKADKSTLLTLALRRAMENPGTREPNPEDPDKIIVVFEKGARP
jgi:hypothetical protein